MGFFDFIRDAGKKDSAHEDSGVLTPERINELREQNIRKMWTEAKLDIENAGVQVKGEQVTISGRVATQAICEKATLVAGNQFGVSKVDCQIEVKQATTANTEKSQFYTVKKGDTLGKIAAAMYGDASQYQKIFEANMPMLEHPDRIYPGQALRIPAAKSA